MTGDLSSGGTVVICFRRVMSASMPLGVATSGYGGVSRGGVDLGPGDFTGVGVF